LERFQSFIWKPKDHVELGKALDILDFEGGAKVSVWILLFKNEGAMLEIAVIN